MLTKKEYGVVGFAGCMQCDILTWIGMVLKEMNQNVLMIDFSESNELKSVVSLPSTVDTVRNVILEYRGISYLRADTSTQIEDYAEDYQIVLADFGRNVLHPEIWACDQLYLITDMYRHNIAFLEGIERADNQHLIVRSFIPGKLEPELVAGQLGFGLSEFTVLEFNEREYLQYIAGQYAQEQKMNRITLETRRLLFRMAEQIADDKKACNMVMRGLLKGRLVL